jgi:hypothetical protein
MWKTFIQIAAVCGLALPAFGQGVTLHFTADRSTATRGEVVHWVVSASFSGYGDTAYFGQFEGDFLASNPMLGLAFDPVSLMQNSSSSPTAYGAHIQDINIWNSALLGTNDSNNPLEIFEFNVQIGADEGSLSYLADGSLHVFPDNSIFSIPDIYDAANHVVSDTVEIQAGGLDPPDVMVELVPDQCHVYRGETVEWTVRAGFSGWDEPAAFVERFTGDLTASDPLVGGAGGLQSLIGSDIAGTPDGASLFDVDVAQPDGGPYDTSNPIDLFSFDVTTGSTGVLSYGIDGDVWVTPEPAGFAYGVSDLIVDSGEVEVLTPPADFTLFCSADRAEVSIGETVRWTVSASFTGIDDPAGYFGALMGDLTASDSYVGLVTDLTNLLDAGDPGTPDGGSILGMDIRQDADVEPVDTANPIDLLVFDVECSSAGMLSYGFTGPARLFPNNASDGWLVDPIEVLSDSVEVHEPCSAVDLALPYGLLDLADINAFVASFLDGCDASSITELVPVEAYRAFYWEDCDWDLNCDSGSGQTTDFGYWSGTTIGADGAWGSLSGSRFRASNRMAWALR